MDYTTLTQDQLLELATDGDVAAKAFWFLRRFDTITVEDLAKFGGWVR